MSLYHESITMPTRKELLQRQRFLEKTKAKLERSLAAAPPGRLSTSKKMYTTVADAQTQTSINYYHVMEDGRRVYLSRSRQTTIARLAQKEYARKALALVKVELKQLNDVLKYCETPKLEDAWQDCLPEKLRFVDPPVLSDEVFRQKWLSQEYDRKPPMENDHRFPTEKGDPVCSKTEAQQADYMFYHGYSTACSTRSVCTKRMDMSLVRTSSSPSKLRSIHSRWTSSSASWRPAFHADSC